MKSFFYAFWEIIEVVLVAIIAVFVIRNFLVQPFLVSGDSMRPNFSSGDYLLVDEISYRFREPERGEVIVFKYPGDEKTYYIKRIIGLPEERISIKDGQITIFNGQNPNGFVPDEGYLPEMTMTDGDEEVILGSGEYFVMGDNRNYSFDSRKWGNLQKAEIIGLVRLRLWPFNEVMAFEKPIY
jgi:signal peptidase I